MHHPIPESFLTTTMENEDGGRFLYVNNPGDHGGPTKGGITQATLAAWRGHPVSASDVRNMTIEEWRDIMTEQYWTRPGLDLLPLPNLVMGSVFDAGVMSGPFTAIWMLQSVVGAHTDGSVGDETVAACIDYMGTHTSDDIANAYCVARIQRYHLIVQHDPSQEKWLHGWIGRATRFVPPEG